MANTYTQLFTHIIFHTKSTGIVMRDEDLSRVFEYIGGIIRTEGAIPYKTKSYHDEYRETLNAYGIEYDERYAFGD